MTRRTRKFFFWFSFAIFITLATIIPLYGAGYRLDKNFNLTLTGGIFISAPESGIEIYLDGKLIRTSGFFRSVFIQNLEPKKYTVLGAKEGLWPWFKEIEVKESAVGEAKALMLSQDIGGKVLLNGNYKTLSAEPEKSILVLEEEKNGKMAFVYYDPFKAEFLSFENKETLESQNLKTDSKNQVEIRLESNSTINRLFAKTIGSSQLYFIPSGETAVLESRESLKNFDFYPKRNDVLIIAIKHGVFAIEIDSRKIRNFQPIYKGLNPHFVLLKNNLYVLDQGALYEINL